MRASGVRLDAQSDLYHVARAAYYYSIEHPDRPDATLDEVLAANPSQADSEFIREAARRAAVDPWGHEVQVTFRSKYLVVVTGAGPDGRLGTDDDLQESTDGWQ